MLLLQGCVGSCLGLRRLETGGRLCGLGEDHPQTTDDHVSVLLAAHLQEERAGAGALGF